MYEPGTHAHVNTQTNVVSTIYEHIHEYECYFQYYKWSLYIKIRAYWQTSTRRRSDASVLGLGIRPLAIWINYAMSYKHSVWTDLDRKDLYRNLPSHDNIWASSKINKNTNFSRSHKCSNSLRIKILHCMEATHAILPIQSWHTHLKIWSSFCIRHTKMHLLKKWIYNNISVRYVPGYLW